MPWKTIEQVIKDFGILFIERPDDDLFYIGPLGYWPLNTIGTWEFRGSNSDERYQKTGTLEECIIQAANDHPQIWYYRCMSIRSVEITWIDDIASLKLAHLRQNYLHAKHGETYYRNIKEKLMKTLNKKDI